MFGIENGKKKKNKKSPFPKAQQFNSVYFHNDARNVNTLNILEAGIREYIQFLCQTAMFVKIVAGLFSLAKDLKQVES